MGTEPLPWDEREKLRAGWNQFLGGQGFDCFWTMTYKEPANSAGLAIDRSKRLLTNFYKSISKGAQVHAFIVAEQHLSGSYHVHGLMRLGVQGDDIQFAMRKGLWAAAHKKYGRARFEPVNDADAVRGYVCKYLTKRVCDYAVVGKGWRKSE